MAQPNTGNSYTQVAMWTVGGIVAIVIVAYLIGVF